MVYMPCDLLPTGYLPILTPIEVQEASEDIKHFVEGRLKSELKLFKHTAPLCFHQDDGINDDLDGYKKPVQFHITNVDAPRGIAPKANKEKEVHGFDAEVVQSLAKWKRVMLHHYGVPKDSGLFCESFSIRKGYKGDPTHSSIVDQWDWEVTISEEQRTMAFLMATVRKIYGIIKDCDSMIRKKWPALNEIPSVLPDEIHFITAEELHAMWPEEDVHGRENAAVNTWGAIFIIGMGWPMKDGSAPEEIRAPDYDDWNLNGDIIVKHPVTGYRHELSSMGIRVNAEALRAQLKHRGMEEHAELPFQKALLAGELPQTMGGGIGISRLLMLLLLRAHVGEVQVGIWAHEHVKQAEAAGCKLIPCDFKL
ncbi:unnamed protein product [Chrysoparadoxa australica]